MRKLFAIGFIAVVSILGLSVSAKASTVSYNPSASSYCNFNPADPQCHQTPPGAPGFCGPTSFGFHGTCTPDTLTLASRTRGHDGNWNNGPQDPCVFHQRQGFGDNSQNSTDFRGCRCETVKIWHTKIVCHKEVWYYTTEVVCRGHHRDPHQCGCQAGGQVQPVIGNKVA